MNQSDTARVLAKIAAFDQRTVGEADVRAWHEVLGDLDYADVLTAVTEHYRDETVRATPAAIRAGSLRIAARRAGQQAALRHAPGCRDIVVEFGAEAAAQVRALGRPESPVNAAGVAKVQAVIDQIVAKQARRDEEPLTPAEARHQAALDRARGERRTRRLTP